MQSIEEVQEQPLTPSAEELLSKLRGTEEDGKSHEI